MMILFLGFNRQSIFELLDYWLIRANTLTQPVLHAFLAPVGIPKATYPKCFFVLSCFCSSPKKTPPSASLQRFHSLFEHFPREMAMKEPKKVAGGAYGQFLAEKRPELQAECKGQPITAVTKQLGWKPERNLDVGDLWLHSIY